jgi:hypothetical protein
MTIQNVIDSFIDSDTVARLDNPRTIQRGLDIAANPDDASVLFWVKYVLSVTDASAAEIVATQNIYIDNGLKAPDFNLVKIPHEVAQDYQFDLVSLSDFFFFGGGRMIASRCMAEASGMVAYFAGLMNSPKTTAQHIYIAMNRMLGAEFNIVLTSTEVDMLRNALVTAGLNPDKVLKLRTDA